MDQVGDVWTVITHRVGHEPPDRLPCVSGFLVSVTIRTEAGDDITIPGDRVVLLSAEAL